MAALQASVQPEEAGWQQEALLDCMKGLSDVDRDLLWFCYGTQRSFREVAEQLGRSPQSAYASAEPDQAGAVERDPRPAAARREHPRGPEERP